MARLERGIAGMTRHAVAGKRILVTRSARDSDRWASQLAALGAEPVVLPCLVFEPIGGDDSARDLQRALASANWLLVTSARGCDATARLLGDAGLPRDVRVAAVGPATANAATKHLGRIDFVSREGSAEGLARELVRLWRAEEVVSSVRVVVVGPETRRGDAIETLRVAGVAVRRIAVYRTIPAPPVASKRDLQAEGIEIVLLASPSAVTGLLACARVHAGVRVITIGPTTSAAASAAGLAIAAEARRPTLEGILEAIV